MSSGIQVLEIALFAETERTRVSTAMRSVHPVKLEPLPCRKDPNNVVSYKLRNVFSVKTINLYGSVCLSQYLYNRHTLSLSAVGRMTSCFCRLKSVHAASSKRHCFISMQPWEFNVFYFKLVLQ